MSVVYIPEGTTLLYKTSHCVVFHFNTVILNELNFTTYHILAALFDTEMSEYNCTNLSALIGMCIGSEPDHK